jgi:Na+/H+ antiporter NhaD/arsenite permease-like protein
MSTDQLVVSLTIFCIVDMGIKYWYNCLWKCSTVLSSLTYVGSLQNTVYQDPLYNKHLHLNWFTFYIFLLCTWIASLGSITLMWIPDDNPISDRNM